MHLYCMHLYSMHMHSMHMHRYLYSMYFSVSAFAGFGDGDFYCASPADTMIMIVYLLFNIVLQAYILGECQLARVPVPVIVSTGNANLPAAASQVSRFSIKVPPP